MSRAGTFILANDEGQANDDLTLAKKLIYANPILAQEVTINAKLIERKDGRGKLQILTRRLGSFADRSQSCRGAAGHRQGLLVSHAAS
jgi:hypothetical protein